MKSPSILILSEKDTLFKHYISMLETYFHPIETMPIASHETFHGIDALSYDFILVDLYGKKYIDDIKNIKNIDSNQTIIFLITPFSIPLLSSSLQSIRYAKYISPKPLDISKFMAWVKKESMLYKHRVILEQKNHVLAKVIDIHPERIAVYDMQGVLFYANKNYLSTNRISLNDIDKFHFDDMRSCNLGFENIKKKLEIVDSFRVQKDDKDGWYESIFYKISQEFIIHHCEDITAHKERELQLEQSSIFFDNSQEGIVITDKKACILSVNDAFCRITGYTKDEAIGKKPSILKSGIHDKNFYGVMWDSLDINGAWQGEVWNRRKNGEIYPEWLSISKASNNKYNETYYIAIFTDISILKEADKKLYYHANHDILTGLANRVNFEEHLKNTIKTAKRNNGSFAIFFVDLDKFKEVNDTYGHSVGDEMLRSVTKRLKESVRDEDFLARIGGDEFVYIIKDAKDQEDMLGLAKKINDKIKEPIEIDAKVFFMTLSIGIAIYPQHGNNSEDLIKNADAAMYEVKENGRNSYALYNEDMTTKVANKVQTQNEIKRGIKDDEFEMFYQPIIRLKDNKIVGAEALVRWHHPQRGLLSPLYFIDIAEDSHLCEEFNDHLFKKVLHDMQSIGTKYPNHGLKISINISIKSFFENDFIEKIEGFCRDFSIHPSQIELELLETQIMKSSQIARQKIEQLHKKGFSLAIDDFGTGYSSLSYLKHLKVDKLKIDQSFIRDMIEDDSDRAIAEAIIKLTKTFKMHSHAEGVETKDHHELLQKLKCLYAQGYYYAKPMPLNAFIDMVKEEA